MKLPKTPLKSLAADTIINYADYQAPAWERAKAINQFRYCGNI